MMMAVENAETHRLNVDQLLYNIEHRSRIIVEKIEKLRKKLVLNSSGILFNQVYIDETLLSEI